MPNSVRNSAPVGHTSRHAAWVQCLQTSEDISHRTPLSSGAGGNLPNIPAAGTVGAARADLDLVALADSGALPEAEIDRWLFQSDVCTHCTNADTARPTIADAATPA